MLRTALLSLSMLFLCTAAGCPDREELVDTVGGAPGRQMDDVRARTHKAEDKIKAGVDEAAAVGVE